MILQLLLVTATALFSSENTDDTLFSEEKWRAAAGKCDSAALFAPHLRKGRFFNPWMDMPEHRFLDIFKSHIFGKGPEYSAEEENHLPNVLPWTPGRIQEAGEGDFVLWVGHSTFLLRLNGAYFITDPVFSERIAVPRRKTLPAFTVKEMLAFAPRVNVLLTHNHHDHLDLASIKALPAGTRVFAPLGLRDLVRDLNRKSVKEMDWWQSADAGSGVAIHCLPAQHWSLRLLTRTNTSLWCSFMIVTDKVVIYFGGDSGYFIGYREIAKRFPKIDYAILPMGAYRPRWFMHYSHLDPEEVLKAASDLNSRHVIPMHWGAFALGEEPAGFPGLDLRRLLQKNPMDSGKVLMPAIGEFIKVKD